MKYHEMTKNYIFREFECGLSIEDTAKICFKSARTVTQWDNGKAIPNECRKLMKMHQRLELSTFDEWEGFYIKGRQLELPTGEMVSPQQILTGIALIQIESELELMTTRKLLKLARAIATIKSK